MINKEVVIMYFSATGNTKFAAEQIKKHLIDTGHSVELLSAENTEQIASTDFNNKLLGIGFPCYAFDYPHKVLDRALECIQIPHKQTPAFIFTTYCIGDGISRVEMKKQLKKRNFTVISADGFKCPSSGFYTVKSGTERGPKAVILGRITKFQKDIKSKIKDYSHKVSAQVGQSELREVKILKPKFISLLPKCFAKWNEKRIFMNYSIDNEKCGLCGVCMDNCTVDNFKMVDNRMTFVNKKDCLRCMRCINNCPQDAIALGKQTVGKLRYTNEVRQRLLED